MSVHSNTYDSYEEYKRDLYYEYRAEQNGLYWGDEKEEPDCGNCKHLRPRTDGSWECPFGVCEYEEKE